MERDGYIQLDGWHGRIQQLVPVVGETPKRFRIRAITKTKLAGRQRWIGPGQTALVPKHGVTDKPLDRVPITN
jgi:hypothetical protein